MAIVDLERHEMWQPLSLTELLERLAERGGNGQKTVLLAGGTDWVVEQEMAKPSQPAEPLPLLCDISRLAELRGIAFDGDRLKIGAAATYIEMRRFALTPSGRRAALLARMAQDLGAVQIQARGTLGGNLATASPAADGVAALAAYDAEVILRSASGERRVPMREYQTGYKKSVRQADEAIIAFEIDVPKRYAWYWRKVGTRRAQSISKVAMAGVAVVEGGRVQRIGLGMASVAPVTALLSKTRHLLLETPLTELTASDVDAAVLSDVSPMDDVRSTREYRSHCACVLVKDFLRQLGARM